MAAQSQQQGEAAVDPKKKQKKRRSRRRKPSPHKRRKSSSRSSGPQTWRVYGVEVHPDQLISDASSSSSNRTAKTTTTDKNGSLLLLPDHETDAIRQALARRLHIATAIEEGEVLQNVTIVRRSLDARRGNHIRTDGGRGPRHVYVLDVTVTINNHHLTRNWKHQPGRLELLRSSAVKPEKMMQRKQQQEPSGEARLKRKPHVVIVGCGPAGLFAALTLVERHDIDITILERGQPVERRGRDIGQLVHRHLLKRQSNFCFGEGGAGTFSDGKLTTRIGRNTDRVQKQFLQKLVYEYGAPTNILYEGAPHLGTDNLVRILRNIRHDLQTNHNANIRFGAQVTKVCMEPARNQQDGGNDEKVTMRATGVEYITVEDDDGSNTLTNGNNNDDDGNEKSIMGGTRSKSTATLVDADAVILATGHSARDVYEQLYRAGVQLEPKGFAVGYRVEHPQRLINKIQYGREWGPSVITGKKTTDVANQKYFDEDQQADQETRHPGKLPVPSYRLATDHAWDGHDKESSKPRGVYSFCMCPGGQVVPASTDPHEVCVNGMSFSRRDSQWANSALVVTVDPEDKILEPYREKHGVLAGIAFQRDMEQKASNMGGGNLTVPVQRLTDFVEGRPSTTAPSSSYRLNVKPAACHEIYPSPLIHSLRYAITECFDKQMPGFYCEEGLLHAVETRTSSPVRICRDRDTLEAVGTRGLFPAGEGAGFAGGIVSAAVDGMVVAEAVLEKLIDGYERNEKDKRGDGKTSVVGMMY